MPKEKFIAALTRCRSKILSGGGMVFEANSLRPEKLRAAQKYTRAWTACGHVQETYAFGSNQASIGWERFTVGS